MKENSRNEGAGVEYAPSFREFSFVPGVAAVPVRLRVRCRKGRARARHQTDAVACATAQVSA